VREGSSFTTNIFESDVLYQLAIGVGIVEPDHIQ